MLKIRFAPQFDTGVWDGPIHTRQGSLGRATVGELGLLEILETHLGLKRPDEAPYLRKTAYLDALHTVDDDQRFYSASFKKDPMAVAEQLLSLRDQLLLAKWDGRSAASLTRLRDLAVVEAAFKNDRGLPDRLLRVSRALETRGRLAALASLELFIDINLLPALWRELIMFRLPAAGVHVSERPGPARPAAAANLELHRLAELSPEAPPLKGDGSLFWMEARDPWECARHVAVHLELLGQEQLRQTVIVAPERHRGILLAALRARGIPFGGNHTERSFSLAALQILLLALDLSWHPKDPARALSLLHNDHSPVPGRYRGGLIRSFAQSLKVGGVIWNQALDETIQALNEQAQDDEEKSKIAREAERIRHWFNAPSFAEGAGIPLAELITTASRVATWLHQKWLAARDPSLIEAHVLCRELLHLAANLKLDHITREQVFNLLTDVIGDGVTSQSHRGEAGGPRIVSDPGALLEPADHVVWWDFTAAAVASHRERSFSETDIEALRTAGIDWPDAADRSQIEGRLWRNPILMARKSLLLAGQALDSTGEAESPHPLLAELFPRKEHERSRAAIHVNLKERQTGSVRSHLRRLGANERQAPRKTFVPRPKWQLTRAKLELKPTESANSLTKLLGCELAYVLDYIAHIRDGDRGALDHSNATLGIIAHEVLATVFRKGAPPTPTEAEAEASRRFNEVVAERAPQLELASQTRQREDLKNTLLFAVRNYASFLSENGLEVEGAETDIPQSEFRIGSSPLEGKLDHVLRTRDNGRLVIDHKWGSEGHHREALESGRSLQLAVYSKLLGSASDTGIGYHIIQSQRILLLNASLKRTEMVDGPPPSDLLSAADRQFGAKTKLLAAGKISAPGLDPANEDETFSAPCRFCNFTRICGNAWQSEKK
jgi:ATP-dependent helicase/nuclease subunit B